MHFLVLLSALVACAAGVPSNTTKPTRDGRIVGGTQTIIEDHPHQVALLQSGSFICGGSIKSPTCIVTAAHCVVGVDPSYLIVRSCSTNHASGGTVHNVIGGFYHGRYNEEITDYDVAVLRIDPPITYSNCAQSIALLKSEVPVGYKVVVTGWGITSTGGPVNPTLLKADLQVADDATCNDLYSRRLTDRMICAGNPRDVKSPCNGDSGGPLATTTQPPVLVGIVSLAARPCGPPAVYAKVSALWYWISFFCSVQKIPLEIIKAGALP